MPDADLSGKPKIANIEILELIGVGGMSRVYKARQNSLDRLVAIKVLVPELIESESAKSNFDLEAKLTSSLNHPSIVKVLGAAVSEDQAPYLILEYVEGPSLAEFIKDQAPLSYKQFQEIFLPLLSALEHAHQLGILHRDIKPSNIIISKNENDELLPKLLDFGIAKLYSANDKLRQTMTPTALARGTPMYMSPEQCNGQIVDARTDLYSLACVMYESLSGKALFNAGSALETMHAHTQEKGAAILELCRQMEIPEALARVFHSALSKDKNARPSSAEEFRKLLAAALAEMTLDKRPSRAPVSSSAKQVFRIPISALLLLMVCISIAAVANYLKMSSREAAKSISVTTNAYSLISDGEKLAKARKLQEAYKQFDQARLLLEKSGSKTELAYCLVNCCNILAATDYSDAACKKICDYASRAEKIYERQHLEDKVFDCGSIKIDALIRLKDDAGLEKELDSLLSNAKNSDTKLIRAGYLTEALLERGYTEKAFRVCDDGSSLAEKMENAIIPRYRLQFLKAAILWKQKKETEANSLAKNLALKLLKNSDITEIPRESLMVSITRYFLPADPKFLVWFLENELKNNSRLYAEEEYGIFHVRTMLAKAYLAAKMNDRAKETYLYVLGRCKKADEVNLCLQKDSLSGLIALESDPVKLALYKKQLSQLPQ